MPTSTSVQRTVLVGVVLILTLGACGQQRASDSAAGAGSSASPSAPGASPYVEPGGR